ncbi:13357_t:CDS:1 [Funneliformis geosporum]|uniref:18669_t:CDS:1 n=1 Tax=Funneliformis geosporum TaxID=1117311 RepID=A0A9W4SVP7_9GLOM|nr:18669_t:CDS:1 [Funneliformis geosporum]CAI2195549.1 13357_t:CDS:1 [Funneliformis geosporum]
MTHISFKSTLHHWLCYSQRQLLLDLRPLHDHYTRRIIPSTCIPLANIKKHLFELPPKSLPFAVLEPHGHRGVTHKLLIDQGWNVPWILIEGEELWKVSRELGILEEIDKNNDSVKNYDTEKDELNLYSNRSRWVLFQPSPFLMNNIDFIEESLKTLSKNHVFNCLDVACGSGRDVAWLSLRQTVDWRITAIDSMSRALDRTRQLTSRSGVLDKIQTVHVKIMANGSVKKNQELSTPPQMSLSKVDGNSEVDTRPKLDKKIIMENQIEFLNKKYDLVLTIRFLNREFLSTMANLVKPDGFLLISTFVNDGKHTYKNPKSNSNRLELGELDIKFRKEFEVIKDEVELIEDGRPVNSFLARKKREI